MAVIDIDRPTPRQCLALIPLSKAEGDTITADFVRHHHIPIDALYTFLGNICRVMIEGRAVVFPIFSHQEYTEDGLFDKARISPQGRNYLKNLRNEHF